MYRYFQKRMLNMSISYTSADFRKKLYLRRDVSSTKCTNKFFLLMSSASNDKRNKVIKFNKQLLQGNEGIIDVKNN